MFTKKTQKKKVVVPTVETRTINVPTAEGLKAVAMPALAAAVAAAKNYSDEAADWAKPRLEQGKAVAEEGAAKAKDLAGNSAKLSALTATAAGSKAAQRSRDAALVLKGDATIKKNKKKSGGFGKLVLNLGLLSALAAVVGVVVKKMQEPKDDPWARPLTDPYVAPAAGRDTTVAAGEGVKVTEVADQSGDTTHETEIIAPEGQVPTQASTTTFRTEGDTKN